MSFLMWRNRDVLNFYAPASYSADENKNVSTFQAGDLIGAGAFRVNVAFDGTGGRTFKLGDASSNGRFSDTSDVDITTAGLTQAVGVAGIYLNRGEYLYTAATTMVIYFTAATGGGPTAGKLSARFAVAKQFA